MTLDAHEIHPPLLAPRDPKGFVRVRHFGLLANRFKSLLSKCRQLLNLSPTVPNGFFVMIAQRPNTCVFAALAGAGASVALFYHLTHFYLALDWSWLHGRDRSLPQSVPGLRKTCCAAVFAQLDVLMTIPIDHRHCFTNALVQRLLS